MISSILQMLWMLALLACSAFFSGAETAIFSLDTRACRDLVTRSTNALLEPDRADIEGLLAEDEVIDQLQELIRDYVIELMEREIPESVSAQVPAVLHAVNDLERVETTARTCSSSPSDGPAWIVRSNSWSNCCQITIRKR